MASYVVFLIFYLSFILPLQESIIIYSQRVTELSEIDEKLAEGSEFICSSINKALRLNQALERLYLECASAHSPPQLMGLQIKGELIEQQQNFYLMRTQHKVFELKKAFEVKSQLPLRSPRGPCALPGLLSCLNPKTFSLLRKNKNESGGSVGTSFQCKEIKWEFQDPRVKEL